MGTQEAVAYNRVQEGIQGQQGKEPGLLGKQLGPGMQKLWAGKWVDQVGGIRRVGILD